MPRMISFALTTAQFVDGSKDVTRRDRWLNLKAGDILMAVEKAMGLGKGGKVKRLGLIRVKDVRREPLRRMVDDLAYGCAEVVREGFPDKTPVGFVAFYSQANKCDALTAIVTRIEFEKVDGDGRHSKN
jgi:hypothetical protein